MKNILLFLPFLLLGCDLFTDLEEIPETNKSNTNENRSREVNVSAKVLTSTEFEKEIISNGKISAKNKGELKFQIPERLTDVFVSNGDLVEKGQVLAKIENKALLNRLARTKLELEKAKIKLQEEKINFSFESEENEFRKSELLKKLQILTGYDEALNNLESAEIEYNETLLKAPFTGVVANLFHKVGNQVSPSEIFCVIISHRSMEVTFYVMESELSFIRLNQNIRIEHFYDDGIKYNGIISEINPLVDENGLVKIVAKILNSSEDLLDGMNVKIVVTEIIQNTLVIPKEAVVTRSNEEVVFSLNQGMAYWNFVEIINENSRNYEIKRGLKIGDTVIISNNANLSHDSKVDVTIITHN